MSWYGQHMDSNRRLESIIDKQPELKQLLGLPDFIQQLKGYSPKLLNYLSNSSQIIQQMILYLSQEPKISDNDDRKYRLPLLTLEMVEADVICILISFFKINIDNKIQYLVVYFKKFLNSSKILLPLLCGYFMRVNYCLNGQSAKQAVDCIYSNPICFELLLQHCNNLSIVHTLQLYLNLDLTKHPIEIPQRIKIKMDILNKLFIIMANQHHKFHDKQINQSQNIISNICLVLGQIIQKYYLITDGKIMMQAIICENSVQLMIRIALQGTILSVPILVLLEQLIKYYSLSSLNTDNSNLNLEIYKKNVERLQAQILIRKIPLILPKIIQTINKTNKITIHHLTMIEMMNKTVSLNSNQIVQTIRQNGYFQFLINLLFNWPNLNILHKSIQKIFITIFTIPRKIHDQYQRILFCEVDLIQITANRHFKSNRQQLNLTNVRNVPLYFGSLMKIMKIYSHRQPTNSQIIQSIRAKNQIWAQITNFIIRPYEQISMKQLGSYDGVAIGCKPIQFHVQNPTKLTNQLLMQTIDNNTKVIEQINREQCLQNIKTIENTNTEVKLERNTNENITDNMVNSGTVIKNKEKDNDNFFKVPETSLKKPVEINQNVKEEQKKQENNQQQVQKNDSFKDFMDQQKVQAERQIRLQRSVSHEKKLSAGKTRLTSQSPRRKNKWDINPNQKQQQEKLKLKLKPKSNTPLIPIPGDRKKLTATIKQPKIASEIDKYPATSTSLIISPHQEENSSLLLSKSMVDLEELKNIKVKMHAKIPLKREYRKISDKDLLLLNFLGYPKQVN